MSILESDVTYQISLKEYFALMPYITHPKARDIKLDHTGIVWVNSELGECSYASMILKEQVDTLFKDILYIHCSTYPKSMHFLSNYRKILFLKKTAAGLLHLKDDTHHVFYKNGLLSIGITNYHEGVLCINTLESEQYINYTKFSYYVGSLT